MYTVNVTTKISQTDSPVPEPVRKPVMRIPNLTRPPDEFANFVTHGMGFLLSLGGTIVLMRSVLRHGDTLLVAACIVYCLSLMGLYAASTLSHAFYDHAWRRIYRTVDQICIFFLIAGSFTPFAAEYLRSGLWPLLILSIWTLALIGAGIVWHHGYLSAGAQTIYLALGWLPAISLVEIVAVAPQPVTVWIIVGGLFYTTGTLFLWLDHKMRYFHAMWHLFVIAGSVCQYIAILLLVAAR